jgi:hypothetical protein
MKRFEVIAFLSLALTLVLGAFGQRAVASRAHQTGETASQSTLKETLEGLERQSWQAWKKRDGKFFSQFLSDDHVEVGATGVANKEAVVATVASPVCVVNSYAVDRFKLTVFDANTALLTYHAAQDTTCAGKAVPSPVWASSLYIRRGGRWLNALYQHSPAVDK